MFAPRATTCLLAALAMGTVLASPTQASAQNAPAGAAALPDRVTLKDGSMFRGTILENVVGDHVDLQLANGEVRRFPAADVSYAGPAPQALPAPPPPPVERPRVEAEGNPVHFEATTPDTDFHVRTSEATGLGWSGRGMVAVVVKGYDHICPAPCDKTLPSGSYRLALSQGGGTPAEADSPIHIDGPSTVRGTYVSNAGLRVAGWVVMVGSLAVGMGMSFAGLAQKSQDCSAQQYGGTCLPTYSTDTGLLYGGVAVMTVGPLASLFLIFQHDHADISVVPLSTGAIRSPLMSRAEAASPPPQGLAVRLAF
jgi:hypothetical protein